MSDVPSRSVSVVEEKRICTGLIVSTEFISKIRHVISLDYFTNSYLKTVADWCLCFYDEHQKAPYIHIMDIYESESHNLTEANSELIGTLLKTLSEQYDENNINVEYLKDGAEDYFRKRELEITVNNIIVLKEKGDIEAAEAEIQRFSRITVDIDQDVFIDPGDEDQREELYRQRDEEEKSFFRLPGDLGKYLGNHKRGDVVGYYAPAKRGKCLSGDNFVYLSDGTIKTVKDVVDNKISNILCMSKNHKIIKGKVVDWVHSGEKLEFEVTTKSGQKIRCSKDHRFYSPEGWKKLKELKNNDIISISKNISLNIQNEGNTQELKLLAYLIADGHLGPTRISFTKHDDDIRNDFISCVNYFKDTFRIDKSKQEVTIHVGTITKMLKEYDLFGKLSGDKFIPDHILKCNNSDLSKFLNILFTCDGSIWSDRGVILVDYSTKSKILAQQILYCLNRFSITGKLKEKIVNNVIYYGIGITSNSNVQKFIDNIGFSYRKKIKSDMLCQNLVCKRDYIDIIPNKYVNEVDQIICSKGESIRNETFRRAFIKGTHTSRYTFEKIAGANHPILNTDLLWDRIISIKKLKIVPMYDLSIENNHNFIVNGFIVHNSFTLINNWAHGVLQKRKTLFWSIEMTKTEVITRTDKCFIPMIDAEEGEGMYTYPVFDCIKNQMGECADRMSRVIVLDDEELIDDPSHVACIKCQYHDRQRYEQTVWQLPIFREQSDIFTIRKRFKPFNKMLSKYGKISCHKKYTLTYDKMMRDLDVLYSTYNFIPDILIVDYIDILGINSKHDDYKEVDEKWKLIAKVAGETNTLVITATQANKSGHSAEVLDASHQGGFYGKNQHVNLMVGLNQTPAQKAQGVMKFGITEARSQKYIPGQTCSVLQDIATGQSYLDSYY